MGQYADAAFSFSNILNCVEISGFFIDKGLSAGYWHDRAAGINAVKI
jgi:hypothetical protein